MLAWLIPLYLVQKIFMLFDNASMQDYFTVEVVTDEIGVIFFLCVIYFYQIIFYIDTGVLYINSIYTIYLKSFAHVCNMTSK